MKCRSSVLLAGAALLCLFAAASAQAPSPPPKDRDQFYKKCNDRKYTSSKKNQVKSNTAFCCAHWSFDKKKSQKNCNSIYDNYKALVGAVLNESIANINNNIGQQSLPNGITGFKTDVPNKRIELDTDSGPLYADLSELFADTIKDIALGPDNKTLVITNGDGNTTNVDLTDLLSGFNGVKDFTLDQGTKTLTLLTDKRAFPVPLGPLFDGTIKEITVVNGTITVVKGDGNSTTIDLSKLVTGLALDPVTKTSVVLTFYDGTTAPVSLIDLLSANGVKAFRVDATIPTNHKLVIERQGLAPLEIPTNDICTNGCTATSTDPKAVKNFTLVEKELTITTRDDSTFPVVVDGICTLCAPPKQNTTIPAVDVGGNSQNKVKRCPKDEKGVQLVVKNAFCYCSITATPGTIVTGNQAAVAGIMIQQFGGTQATPAPGPFCNMETEPQLCVQAQCLGTSNFCNFPILTLLCGYP